MDASAKNKIQQYGFYEPSSKQFYTIPAESEEEFKKFLEKLGIVVNQTETPGSEERFDDFDFVVDEISKTP